MDIPNGLIYDVRAEPAPLEEPEDHADLPGTPTAAELRAINTRMSLAKLTKEQVFTWPFVISNNQVDSYWTWMHESTLKNYLRQAQTDRGVPFMTNHNIKANTTGRVFAGELIKQQPEKVAEDKAAAEFERAKSKGTPAQTARDVFARAGDPVTLVQKAYMVRGIEVNGQKNDDLIANIVAGVQASYSVGLSAYGPDEPGSALICDICGADQFRASLEDCPHFPGLPYEMSTGDGDNKQAVLATSHWMNAKMREASAVYLGATPGTFTQRAQELYAARMMSAEDARLLEDRMHLTRGYIVGESARMISVPRTVAVPTQRPAVAATSPAVTPMEDRMIDKQTVLDLYGSTPERIAELQVYGLDTDPARALHQAWAARLAESEQERAKLAEQRAAFDSLLREKLSLGEGEDIGAGVARITAEAELGQQLRSMAEDELIRQMVRGGLIRDVAQADAQRALIAPWDLKQVVGQIAVYRAAADDRLRNPATGQAGGRVSTPPETSAPREAQTSPARRFVPVHNRA